MRNKIMASLRKTKKIRWKSIKPMIDKIQSYGHKFTYKYGDGYFIFVFDKDEYNLHITFNAIPDIKIGIWKCKKYGNKNYYFFAEHFAMIDRFKPSAVKFTFDTLDDLMQWVNKLISDKDYYYSEMMSYHEVNHIKTIEEFNEYVEKERFADSHNYLDKERYEKDIKKFNKIVNSIDTKLVDVIWRESSIFKQLYDVFLYTSSDLSDEEFNKLEKDLISCDCDVWYDKILPIHYWKHRRKYQMKVHPDMEIFYTNEKKHKRFYRNLK